MHSVRAAEVSQQIHAPKERIWQALTTPALLKQFFFGADVKSTWKEGDPITFSGEYDGKSYVDKGVIRSSNPGEQLSFTHWSALSGQPDEPENYHVVTIDLNDRGRDVTVTLVQEDQDGEAVDEKTRKQFEKNWSMVLQGLK